MSRNCAGKKKRVLLAASVASMIDQFNMSNIRLLQDMGYEVHTACNFEKGNTCDEKRIRKLKKMLRDMGVKMHRWDCPRELHSLKECRNAYRQMQKLLERYAVEWLHCHSPIGAALARLAALQAGVPVIYTAHGFHFYRGAPLKNWLLYYPAEKVLAHWTDALITVNREDYRFARRHLRAEKIFYIPGVGTDTAHFKKLQDEGLRNDEKRLFHETYQIPQNAFVLLSVGELNKGKNHRIVIDAASALHRKDVYYLICGQGAWREKLLYAAKRQGFDGQLRMPGYQENLAWVYRNADIFVFPSIREGMPVALMEAMAAGLPCVVSDIRGSRELMRDAAENIRTAHRRQGGFVQGGFRFSLHCPHQLAQALRILLEDEGLRQKCGTHNQEMMKRYDQAAVDRRMKKIYEEFDICMAEQNAYDRCSGYDKDSPKISVIMPVYNMADDPLLDQAVNSILHQTFQDWELILCDDGSTDDTLHHLYRFAVADQRIHILKNPVNRGAGYARNACLRTAAGMYIALMDADDFSDSKRLEKQADFLESHPEYAFVGCNVWLRDRQGVWGRRRMEERPDSESFLDTLPFVHPSVMIRAEAVHALGGYSQMRIARRAEDYEFFMRLYAAGYRGYNMQQELLGYLEEPDSYRRRKYKSRIAECAVRLQGFRRLGILKGHSRYVLKPLAVGLLPARLLYLQHKRRFAAGNDRNCDIKL